MTSRVPLRLGVNIDHVATIRNARGGGHPDPVRAAELAVMAGADGITAHLREDRRHIGDDDISRLIELIPIPINLEMAATEEMLAVALRHKPHAACIVPERREERTTEGGLDAAAQHNHLAPYIARLSQAAIRVSLFIEPDMRQIEAAKALGAPVVELHVGAYCDAALCGDAARAETLLKRIWRAADAASALGLEVHAGHGITYDTVASIARHPWIAELNIGHFIVGEAIFVGLEPAIQGMRRRMEEARREGLAAS